MTRKDLDLWCVRTFDYEVAMIRRKYRVSKKRAILYWCQAQNRFADKMHTARMV